MAMLLIIDSERFALISSFLMILFTSRVAYLVGYALLSLLKNAIFVKSGHPFFRMGSKFEYYRESPLA
jgi:hypothetical protein